MGNLYLRFSKLNLFEQDKVSDFCQFVYITILCKCMSQQGHTVRAGRCLRSVSLGIKDHSVCLPACLLACLCLCVRKFSLSLCINVCVLACLSVCMSVSLSATLLVCLCVCQSLSLSVCLFDCLSVCLSVCIVRDYYSSLP